MCPECPDCPEPAGPLLAGLRMVRVFVMDVPGSVGEAVWRLFSVVGLSALLVGAWIGWRYPETVQAWLSRTPSPLIGDRLQQDSRKQQRAMEAISAFVRHYRPARFALVSWPTATTAETLWATSDTREWPIHLNGVMGPSMIPAVGPLVFGECWDGSLDTGPRTWHLCPISDSSDVWGFVIAQWPDGGSPQGIRALRHLAERIEGLIY